MKDHSAIHVHPAVVDITSCRTNINYKAIIHRMMIASLSLWGESVKSVGDSLAESSSPSTVYLKPGQVTSYKVPHTRFCNGRKKTPQGFSSPKLNMHQSSTEAAFCHFWRIRSSCRIRNRNSCRIHKLLFKQNLLFKQELLSYQNCSILNLVQYTAKA